MPNRWVKWLKAYFIFGAVIDGLAAVMLLSPRLTNLMFGLEVNGANPDLRFFAGYAATLMTGWTALLVWAAFNPVGRAFVGPLTAIPVLAGLMATEAAALAGHHVDSLRVVPILVVQLAWCVLWFLLYRAVRRGPRAGVERGRS